MNSNNGSVAAVLYTDPQMMELHERLDKAKDEIATILAPAALRTKELMPDLKAVPFEQILDMMLIGVTTEIFVTTMNLLDPSFLERTTTEIENAMLDATPTSKTVH